ncbi:hypothetical protein [Haliangium sp.]|uniref:hypothetical protein n=1 Tax=Haliangium sp. TaxID=2663208 RepID=UPI003D0EECF1
MSHDSERDGGRREERAQARAVGVRAAVAPGKVPRTSRLMSVQAVGVGSAAPSPGVGGGGGRTRAKSAEEWTLDPRMGLAHGVVTAEAVQALAAASPAHAAPVQRQAGPGSAPASGSPAPAGAEANTAGDAEPAAESEVTVAEVMRRVREQRWDVDSLAAELSDAQMQALSADERVALVSHVAGGHLVGNEDERTLIRLLATAPAGRPGRCGLGWGPRCYNSSTTRSTSTTIATTTRRCGGCTSRR